MQTPSIFKQIYAPNAGRVVHGFDGAVSHTSCRFAVGKVTGTQASMPAIVKDEDASLWHIVNLKHANGFDSVAVLGAFDHDEAAHIAQQHYGRFFDSVIGAVVESNTGGLQRYLNHAAYHTCNRPVYANEVATLQDMASGQKILWDGVELKSHQGSVKALMLDMLKHDDELALLEQFDGLDALLDSLDAEIVEYDALIVESGKLDMTMNRLTVAMDKASGQGVKVVNFTKSKPTKIRGSNAIQVAVSFELTDGQAATIIFNHADTETQKLGIKDTLFSWKFKLNNRDVSAAVQPNNAKAVRLDELARRMMKLVNANSERFVAAQAKKQAVQQQLEDSNARIAQKQETLNSINAEIEQLKTELDELGKVEAEPVNAEPASKEPSPIVLTGNELGDFPDTEEGKKALRAAAKAEFEKLLGQWVECPALASKVEIRKLGLKKILSTSADTRKLEIIPRIKELIRNAEKLKTIPPYDANVDKSAKAYHILRSGFTLDGQDLFARIVVKEDVNGIFHYDHSILEKVEHELFDCMQEKSPLLNSELNSVATSNDEGTCPSRLASHQLNFSIEIEGNLVNTFDAVGDKYVLNLFIEGEDDEQEESQTNTQEPQDWLEELKRFTGNSQFDKWAKLYGIDNEIAKTILDTGADHWVVFCIVAGMIPPNLELLRLNDSDIFSYWLADPDKIKALSNSAFEALRYTYEVSNKSRPLAYTILRYSNKKAELDYVKQVARMRSHQVDNSASQGGKLFNMAMQYMQQQPTENSQQQIEVQPMNEHQADIDYLNSVIGGSTDLSNADEVEARLTEIHERLTPETEALFEQAADAFAQYAISLEV